jgi:hypothetical protein
MSSQSLIAVRDDSLMKSSSPGPRSGGPTPRRSITPAQKLDHLAAYEDAILRNEGGAYLREQGIYSSQITECANSVTPASLRERSLASGLAG